MSHWHLNQPNPPAGHALALPVATTTTLNSLGEGVSGHHEVEGEEHTLHETNSSHPPENRPGPKWRIRLPTIDFQVRTVSFKEGKRGRGSSNHHGNLTGLPPQGNKALVVDS